MASPAIVLCKQAIRGREASCMTRRFAPLLTPFPLARRAVRELGDCAHRAGAEVPHRQHLTVSGAFTHEEIRTERPGNILTPSAQPAENERERSRASGHLTTPRDA
jgi:hypothetical protein